MTSTSIDDTHYITCRPVSPIRISHLPTEHLYTALAPSYLANTDRLAPPDLRSDFSEGSSSSSILPPQISPSLLIPLRDTPASPLSPASNAGESTTKAISGSTSLQDKQLNESQYQLALDRLEQANLQDTQMLSSFKRESEAYHPLSPTNLSPSASQRCHWSFIQRRRCSRRII